MLSCTSKSRKRIKKMIPGTSYQPEHIFQLSKSSTHTCRLLNHDIVAHASSTAVLTCRTGRRRWGRRRRRWNQLRWCRTWPPSWTCERCWLCSISYQAHIFREELKTPFEAFAPTTLRTNRTDRDGCYTIEGDVVPFVSGPPHLRNSILLASQSVLLVSHPYYS